MYTVENLFNDIEKYLEEKFNYSKQKKNEGPDIDYPEADRIVKIVFIILYVQVFKLVSVNAEPINQ